IALIAHEASPLKDAIEKDTKFWPKGDREQARAMGREAELLEKDAKVVKERVDSGKPASAEYRTLADRAHRLDGYIVNHSLPLANSTMGTVRAALGKLDQAFGMLASDGPEAYTNRERDRPPHRDRNGRGPGRAAGPRRPGTRRPPRAAVSGQPSASD